MSRITLDDLAEFEELDQEIELDFAEQAESLDFADLPEDLTPERRAQVMPKILKYLLESGDRGYKDGIDEFQPQPTEENLYLWDAETASFKGNFIDRRPDGDRVFAFTISKTASGWSRTFRPVSGVEG